MSRVAWDPCVRLIAARLPRIDVFEGLVPADDLPALLAIEALTNPRLQPTIGPIGALPPEDRITGPGASYVMAPFAYPSASRFGDGRAGVYYAARDLDTAIAEVSYHRARFARTTATPPMDFDERIVEAAFDLELVDLRGLPASHAIYDPTDYTASRARANRERANGRNGLVYASVRRLGGECVALFRPRDLRGPRTAGYIGLRWNGETIIDAFRKASLSSSYPEA